MTTELKIFHHPNWRTENEFIGLVAPFKERQKAAKELITKVKEFDKCISKVYITGNKESSSCLAYDLTFEELVNLGHTPNKFYETAEEFIAAVLETNLVSVKSNKCICDGKTMFYGGCKCGAFQRELAEEELY